MDKYLNKALIIDGSYTLHRALHTPGLEDLTTSQGIKSGGVFGALRMLQAEMKKFPGYFPIVCFDRGLAKRRTDLYPDYKANRSRQEADALIAAGVEEKDDYLEEYRRQRGDLIGILKSFGIPSLLISGWEGDDLMYLLSSVTKDAIVLSDDKDMLQLVSPTCKVRRAMRDELIDYESGEYYHYPRFIIRKSIVGDGSDNIPQVAKGVGETSADKIAEAIGHYAHDEWQSRLVEIKDTLGTRLSKSAEKVLENWSQFEINYQLMDLHLVSPPDGFEQMIKDLVTITAGRSNVMTAYTMLSQYEVTTIFPDQIIAMVAAAKTQVFS